MRRRLSGAPIDCDCRRSARCWRFRRVRARPRRRQPRRPPRHHAPAPKPAGPLLYVSDETGGAVVVIDVASAQVVERITVGKRPRGIRLSRGRHDAARRVVGIADCRPWRRRVEAAASRSRCRWHRRRRSARRTSSCEPERAVRIRRRSTFSPDGKTMYVSNEESAEMSVLDVASGTIRSRVKVGEEPEGVTVRPDGREVYVTCEGDNEVFAVDTTIAESRRTDEDGGATARRRVHERRIDRVRYRRDCRHRQRDRHGEAHRRGIDRDPEGQRTRRRRGRWAQCSRRTDRRCTSRSAARKRLPIIDVAKRALTRTIEDVGDRPWGIAVSADGTKVYTANGPSADVSFVDLASGTVERRIATGGSPWGLRAHSR